MKNFNELTMQEKEKLWRAILEIHKLFGIKSPDFIIFLLECGTSDLFERECIGSDSYNECRSAVKTLYELAKFCGYEI